MSHKKTNSMVINCSNSDLDSYLEEIERETPPEDKDVSMSAIVNDWLNGKDVFRHRGQSSIFD